ncbi:MAG: hypothetical protein FWC65_02730 [Treponema sp.]|nr:hypothetical protein [Treponema sp.]
MAEAFITVLHGVITGKHHGDIGADFWGTPFFGHEKKEAPFEALANITPMEPLEFYAADWQRKSNAELITEGLLPMPPGHVIAGDTLRPMTEVERFEAGLIERPGVRVVDGEFVPMSLQEQLDAGQIAQADYDQRMAADNTAELQQRLAELQTPEALAEAEVDEAFAAERKAKLAALLAVKKQPGWPAEARWP